MCILAVLALTKFAPNALSEKLQSCLVICSCRQDNNFLLFLWLKLRLLQAEDDDDS